MPLSNSWSIAFDSGYALQKARFAAGMSRKELAAAVELHRNTIKYYELRAGPLRGPSPTRMREALMAAGVTLPDIPREEGKLLRLGKTYFEEFEAKLLAKLDGQLRRQAEYASRFAARHSAVRAEASKFCGAKTRRGTSCQAKPLPGKVRCKLHGGASTGAKTTEGRQRIAEAQRRRWARVRSSSDTCTAHGQ